MLKNLLKHSLRVLNRQKSYLLINIAGLSIGIACSLIIALSILSKFGCYAQLHNNNGFVHYNDKLFVFNNFKLI